MSTTQLNNSAGRKKIVRIESAQQWDAISSGNRFEIITFLSTIGPCSIAELARQMDVAADGLYHHIRQLAKAGLVYEAGYEKVGKQNQVIYDVTADKFEFDVQSKRAIAKNVDRLKKLNSTIFRRSERLFSDALESEKLSFNEKNRNSVLRSDTAWLTGEQLDRAKELMGELLDLFETGRKQPEGDLFFITLLFSPLVRSRTSKK